MNGRGTAHRLLTGFAVTALVAGLSAGPATTEAFAATTTISVNGSSGGLVFDGDGAISGGGGNTRLLVDYPETERNAILDYLFKPGYGAQVQILKLELGGSGNSTSGAEPSFEETKGTVDCAAGYEFWLAEQAVRRNPGIRLYGLTWTAPAWVGSTFYNANGIQYALDWLGCAKQHNLAIGYLGGWNEHGYDASWFPQLRTALDSNGYGAVKIVAADANDSGWSTADALAGNPAFKAATAAVGNHYPCSPYNGSQSYTQCSSTATARGLGLPLWSAEEGSLDYQAGGAPMARTDNLVYLQGRMVANINWPIVGSLYPDVSFAGQGLLTADQPWSGHYSVGLSTWAMAHTTQFAQPGWKYLDSGSGYLSGSTYTQGSYVSLKSPNNRDWSTIAETTRATGPQTATFAVTGGLSTGTVHVWSTDLASSDPATWFVREPDVTPDASGQFTVTLQPNRSYSFTTTTGQGKGAAANPPSASLPLPYSDDFTSGAAGSQPRYLAAMEGAFAVRPCVGRTGQCVRQETPARPLQWIGNVSPNTFPYTVGGNADWANYRVSADVMNKVPGSAGIVGRQRNAGVQANAGEDPTHANGYWFSLSDTGAWAVKRTDFSGNSATLVSGTLPGAAGLGTWHQLALTFEGSAITAAIDGTTVANFTDTAYSTGKVGLFTSGYSAGDQFDNLSVTPGSATRPGAQIVGGQSGRCVDLNGSTTANGAQAQLWDCNGGSNQRFTVTSGKQLQVYGSKCLDANGSGTANGTAVVIWDCGSGTSQQWNVNSGGTITGVQSGLCLDANGAGTANATKIILWACNGGANQQWSLRD
jgi:hypothetical protein